MLDDGELKTGDIMDAYVLLFSKLKHNKQNLKDMNNVVDIVYETITEYFGKGWDSEVRNKLLSIGTTLENLRGENIAMCTERAILAQNLFKILGIDSVLKQSMIEFQQNTTPHAYNILRIDGINYIFDSAIPNKINADKPNPIVGKLNNDEYMMLVDGRTKTTIQTEELENGVIYGAGRPGIYSVMQRFESDLDKIRAQAGLTKQTTELGKETLNEQSNISLLDGIEKVEFAISEKLRESKILKDK